MDTVTSKPARHTQRMLWLAGFLAVLVFVFGVWAAIGNPLNPYDSKRFSPKSWKSVPVQHARRRAGMIDGAIRTLPPGTTEPQVVANLGQPDWVISGQSEDNGGNKLLGTQTYVWSIGSMVGGFDDAYLYVHLDAAGKVIRAEVNGY